MSSDNSTLKASGECRTVIGIWGDRSCAELRDLDHCHNCPVYTSLGRQVLDQALELDYSSTHNESDTVAVAPDERLSLLVLRVGSDWLGFETTGIREIIAPTEPHPVPHRLKPGFRGLVTVRGQIHPCIDLGILLGCASAEAPSASPRMVLMSDDSGCFAFVADEVDNLFVIPKTSISQPPISIRDAKPSYINRMVRITDRDIALLDEEFLLHALKDLCQ